MSAIITDDSIAVADTPTGAEYLVGSQGGRARRFLLSTIAAVAPVTLGTVTRTVGSILGLAIGKTPEDYGAVGNGTTDDATALQAWLDSGGHLRLPRKAYRSSVRLTVTRYIYVKGDAFGFDNRLTYPTMPGSRIVFDAGVAGIIVYTQTTESNTDLVVADPTHYFTQEGGANSIFESLSLIGKGGTSGKTGFESRTQVTLRNVLVEGFSGKGFDIQGSADQSDATSDYGNVSLSILVRCDAFSNGSHGFHVRGRDASVVKLDTCNATSNGGWGFLDDGLLGNAYVNCHASTNTSGSFKSSGAVADHSYTGCYVEGAFRANCNIPWRCNIFGGTLAETTNDSTLPATTFSPGTSKLNIVKFSGDQVFPGATTNAGYAYHDPNLGLVQYAAGATYDHYIANKAGDQVMAVPTGTKNANFGGYVRPASFTVSTVPTASTAGAGATIYVSDEAGGAVPAFSDGTNWRRVTDRAVIS